MIRAYKCLTHQELEIDNFKIAPLQDDSKSLIRKWRNEQIDILRQNKILTEADQDFYFADVVNKLFEQEQPKQLLFGFYENGIMIGYGGLVHINWLDRNAEISFLTETSRNLDFSIFKNDWTVYLKLIEKIAFEQLDLIKIYTYAYDIRPHLTATLLESAYTLEASLKKHINIKDEFVDILIHSKFKDGFDF